MAFSETFAAFSLVKTVTNACPGAPGGWKAMCSRYQPSENVITAEASRRQIFTFTDISRHDGWPIPWRPGTQRRSAYAGHTRIVRLYRSAGRCARYTVRAAVPRQGP